MAADWYFRFRAISRSHALLSKLDGCKSCSAQSFPSLATGRCGCAGWPQFPPRSAVAPCAAPNSAPARAAGAVPGYPLPPVKSVIPRPRAPEILHDAVFQRVKRNHYQPSAGLQNLQRPGQAPLQRTKFIIYRHPHGLEYLRRRMRFRAAPRRQPLDQLRQLPRRLKPAALRAPSLSPAQTAAHRAPRPVPRTCRASSSVPAVVHQVAPPSTPAAGPSACPADHPAGS